MFIHQSMNSFFIYQCTDYKLNLVAFISKVLYVYYVIDNNNVVSMETHRFPFSITHQRSAANVRHVIINIFNVKICNTNFVNTQNITIDNIRCYETANFLVDNI